MKKPNFFIIGAGKSGTTALYEYLLQHPEVYMSKIKETNFYELEGQKILQGYNSEDPEGYFHYPWSVTDRKSYYDLFKDAKEGQAVGEASPMYLYGKKAVNKIKDEIPEAKIIVVLRDPVDRLYSRFYHLVREGREPSPNFSDALQKGNIWWKKNDLVQEGFYFTHLKKWYDAFPKEQIKVMLYDDLRKNPQEFVSEIYSFIGVNPDFKPDLDVEYNQSGRIKNKFKDRLIGQNGIIKRMIHGISPSLVEWMKKNKKIRAKYIQVQSNNLEKPKLEKGLRGKMIDEIYRVEIENLQQLIHRDLRKWTTA